MRRPSPRADAAASKGGLQGLRHCRLGGGLKLRRGLRQFGGAAETNSMTFDPPLDSGIASAVEVLTSAGVETFESCEGGHGHAYPEPTVRFHGDHSEGLRALAIAMRASLPVRQ